MATAIITLSPSLSTFPALASSSFPSRKPSFSLPPPPSKLTSVATKLTYSKDPFRLWPQFCSPATSSYPLELELELEAQETHHQILLIRRLLLLVLVCLPLSSVCPSLAAAKEAAVDSIRASGIGLKVAMTLRRLGWPDEAIVFSLATLPVLELRGAIPVGYWLQLNPLHITVLSVLGNMVPVPIIVLYLKKFASFLSQKNSSATKFLNRLFKSAREKAGPIEEFQWLGLMLFVAVPFPGTGAWTGATIAAILDMPFWSAVSANFFGVVIAGLLVNLLVNLGIKYAILVGLVLFFVSTVMWRVLRQFKVSMDSN